MALRHQPAAPVDHSLAEWLLEGWDAETLGALLGLLNNRSIRYDWDQRRSILSTNHLDEPEVDELIALLEEPLEPIEDDDENEVEPGVVIAGVGRRIGGFLLDELFLMTVGTLLVNLMLRGSFYEDGHLRTEWFYASSAVAYVYDVIAVGVWGRTLGKQVVGTRVITEHSERNPGLGRAMARAALPAVVGFVPLVGPFAQVLIYGSALLDDRRRGVHDRVAGTMVVAVRR